MNKKDFHEARKFAMKDVTHEAEKAFGIGKGAAKISRAAWVIVALKPDQSKYLHGRLAGTEESYCVLSKVNSDAVRLVRILSVIRLHYYSDGNFDRVWSKPLETEMRLKQIREKSGYTIDDIEEILCQQTDNKSKKRFPKAP